jgi:hypothetical protein
VPCGGSHVTWTVMQQVEGFKLAENAGTHQLSSIPAWRLLLGTWGDWYLFKAQAVRAGGGGC